MVATVTMVVMTVLLAAWFPAQPGPPPGDAIIAVTPAR
ncbi:hypothetical protein JOF55_000642 [Haloactinomyces albus]|uniref:Uncharacterized protein n=1 Tax=Haloactinomyces albus TaxID=1352928 RepID=A0AAE4CKL0_9ACTN|nr:hypothetical protein [Haloactinomyces albus]